MKYKKGLIFICLLVCLFTVASVVAADMNETVVACEDQSDLITVEDTDYVITLNNQNDENVSVDDGEVGVKEESQLSETSGTFTDLANDIANANGELNLTRNYVYNDEIDLDYKNGIVVNKEIKINGNGILINGYNQAKPLKISSSFTELKNISFVNCSGGAISWLGSYGTLNNCYFKNCAVSSSGGAISWSGSEGTLYNCSFMNCSAKSNGGFICWTGINGSLYNCNFVNSSHNRYGSAIYWSGSNGYLYNSTFINCSAIVSYSHAKGGIIYWQGAKGSLFNCNFLSCSLNIYYSLSEGGYIYWYGINGSLSNCSFENSSIVNTDSSIGFDIYWYGDNGSLSECKIRNNNLNDDSRGFIYCRSANFCFSNCNFSNLFLTKYNSIYCYNSKNSNVILINCNFVNCLNYPTIVLGSYNMDFQILNCSFENCSSSYNGVIEVSIENNFKGSINNCSFLNCSSSRNGGSIYISCLQDGEYDLSNCNFVNCFSRTYGGVIYLNNCKGSVTNCKFTNCSSSRGGAIYVMSSNSNIFKNDFINCSSRSQGGAIFLNGNNCTLFNSSFINCSSGSGGAMDGLGVNNTIFNCRFINCSAGNYYDGEGGTGSMIGGGAVYLEATNSLSNCIFIDCKAPNSLGGAIFSFSSVFDSIFVNCSSKYGGGVYFRGGQLVNSTFINNTVTEKGSGVYMAKGQMINCTFINNNYYWYGGQIIKRDVNLSCHYSSFNYTNPNAITVMLTNLQINIPITGSINFYFVRDINRSNISNCTCINCNCSECSCSNDTTMNFTDYYYFNIPITSGNIASLYDELNNLSIGSWNVDVWYGGDYNYNYASTSFNIKVMSSMNTEMSINTADNYYYGEKSGIFIKVLSNDSVVDEGFVTVYDNDNFIGTYCINGKYMLNYTPNTVGNHKINIYYDGGEFYGNCENSTNIVVSKANPKINVSTSNLTGKGITFYIIMNGNETGNITLNINDGSYKSSITNGKATIDVPISNGEYEYSIDYSGDYNYNPDIFEYKSLFRYNVDYSITPNIVFAGNILNFNFNQDATGKVSINIFNKTYICNLLNGKFIIGGLEVKGGDYNFTLTYEGDGKYNPLYVESQLNVLFKDAPFDIIISDLTYGDRIDLSNVLPTDATGIMEILMDGNSIKNMSVGDEYWYNLLNGGKHYLTLKYSGDEYFKENETTFELNIKKFDTVLFINDTIEANPTLKIVVKLNEDATGLVTVMINNKRYSGQLVNGTYSFSTNKLTVGINSVNINYEGDIQYNSFNLDKEINVLLKDPNLIFDTNNIISGNGLPIKPTVLSGASGTFKVYVDDALKTTINVGTTYYLYQQSLGKHEIKIVYSGDSYFKSETSTSIFRVFAKYPIETTDMKIINGSNKYFQAKFYDEYGEILSNKYVIFNVDGEDYSIRTNSKGIAILNIDFDIGEHDITTINPTASENTTNKLLIFTSVESNDVYIVNNTDFEFNVAFLDNDAEKLMNTPVLFKINGEDKVVTTNAEGVATLKLNLDIGIYNITTINTVTDESKINKLFVKSSSTGKYTREIDEKDINIPSLPSSSSESVTIKLPSDASGTITLNIDGKDYEFNVTDGITNINVPELSNGNYPYTITYSGDAKYSSFSKTGSLTVNKPSEQTTPTNSTNPINPTTPAKPVTKTTLTLKKVKVKRSAKKLTIQATLKINAKAAKGKIIKFKFNKKSYKARTNAKGVAKITVKKSVLKKLKKGKKVTYTATYGKITKKVTVKVKK